MGPTNSIGTECANVSDNPRPLNDSVRVDVPSIGLDN